MQLTGDQFTDLVAGRLRKHTRAIKPEVVAEFCGIGRAAVQGWLAGGRPLGGVFTLKLWHLLEVAGITSPELKKARKDYPLGVYIGRLLAFDVITKDKASEICGNVKDDAIYRAARAAGRLSRCTQTLEELEREYGEYLALAEAELRQTLGSTSVPLPTEEVETPPPASQAEVPMSVTEPAVVQLGGTSRELFILKLAQDLLAGLAAANFAAAQLTPEERTLLRALMGKDGMFQLSNVTERLCGERAFNLHEGN